MYLYFCISGIIHDQCSTWIEFDISYHYKYQNDNSEIKYECLETPEGDMYFEKLTSAFNKINHTGISALIGPFNEAFAHGCESVRIPFLVTSMVPYHWTESPFLIRIVPGIDVYGTALNDILIYLKWRKLGLVYDHPQVPHIFSGLVDKETADIKTYNILNNSSSNNVKRILKELRDKYFGNFILMCSSKNAAIVLTQALYLNMLSRPNAWLVVNLDADKVALEQYEDSRANLTSLLIVMERNSRSCALQSNNLTNAVFYDAMNVLTKLIDLNKNSSRVQMRKNLRKIRIDGCTGLLEYTKVGLRRETFFQMNTLSTVQNRTSALFQSGTWRSGKYSMKDRLLPSKSYQTMMKMSNDVYGGKTMIVTTKISALFQSGTWRSGKYSMKDRLLPSKSYQTMMKMSNDVYGGKTMIVTTKIEPPFVQWKNKTEDKNFTGNFNDQLEGFIVSILDEISKLLNFKYNISLVPDGKFGSKKSYGWTGMVNELIQKRADIALAPFQITPGRSEVVDFSKPFMTKGTSVVVRKPERSEPPFVQWKNKTEDKNFTGNFNDQLEGFIVSILDEIAKLLNFKYNISLVPDGKFGSKKSYGWTGMVNELIQKRADIALAPFQITPGRSEVVDFSKPFMTKGTSVVVRKPERSVSPFQFLLPLSKNVWICIFCSFILAALTLFSTSRMNCDRQEKRMDNVLESFWYIWGTLLRGNLQVSPRGISSRIISCVWWFFSLIVISIYTANLAAFLTISNAHIPIESASDLADQSIYKYGTVEGSQIEDFFKQTTIPYYEKMWAEMSMSGIVRRVDDGFERAMKHKYAFLWDSPTVRHRTAANCGLMEIGNPFDLKGYGIALRKNSHFTESISLALLKLDERGILYRLEGKWWRRPNCPDPRQSAKSREIEIQVASGMFIVLLAGIGLAGLIFVCEILYFKYFAKRRKKSVEEREENNVANTQNHVASTADVKEEEIRCKLARTLSIGENSIHSKWESYDQL
ncbi:Glutamate receptor ionotropic, kainate 1,Glutamate receptor ionotropic, kainate 2 [Mytilus coruscus]|uniref:Glutamate receptor ionotropic, kainate 1,Glutamate receptor ionotropic, kainate 2 n=1 Tax=Mytilus coruscus TaxID=42192 RepID=A0A6J8AZ98_MYTCO|nr:Glutamate receptor ionotropic, kainate 1,Glutamate receptor ionotropic, kainate 2 [Mytilus coruscus]